MRLFASLIAMGALVSLAAVGCSGGIPAPSPTTAPAAAAPPPTKAPAAPGPTKAPETAPAAPTKAPEATRPAPAKVSFPEKGKPITIIVPFSAGGSTDVGARLIAAGLEKELGTPVQVVNRAGGGSQVGVTEFVRARPDGYTLGATNLPSTLTTYLDPDRKAVYGAADILPVALYASDPGVVAVRADSPWKTLKDFLDGVKANPDKVKVGAGGLLTSGHIQALMLGKAAGVEFMIVQFDGDAPAVPAIAGGHIDAFPGQMSAWLPQLKAGTVRILGIMDKEESKFLPGVKTLEAQGYKVVADSSRGFSVQKGTPTEVVATLSSAIKKLMESPEIRAKIEETAVAIRYMGPQEFAAFWSEYEAKVKPLVESLRKSG